MVFMQVSEERGGETGTLEVGTGEKREKYKKKKIH